MDRMTFWQEVKHTKTNGTNYNRYMVGGSDFLMQSSPFLTFLNLKISDFF